MYFVLDKNTGEECLEHAFKNLSKHSIDDPKEKKFINISDVQLYNIIWKLF